MRSQQVVRADHVDQNALVGRQAAGIVCVRNRNLLSLGSRGSQLLFVPLAAAQRRIWSVITHFNAAHDHDDEGREREKTRLLFYVSLLMCVFSYILG